MTGRLLGREASPDLRGIKQVYEIDLRRRDKVRSSSTCYLLPQVTEDGYYGAVTPRNPMKSSGLTVEAPMIEPEPRSFG